MTRLTLVWNDDVGDGCVVVVGMVVVMVCVCAKAKRICCFCLIFDYSLLVLV